MKSSLRVGTITLIPLWTIIKCKQQPFLSFRLSDHTTDCSTIVHLPWAISFLRTCLYHFHVYSEIAVKPPLSELKLQKMAYTFFLPQTPRIDCKIPIDYIQGFCISQSSWPHQDLSPLLTGADIFAHLSLASTSIFSFLVMPFFMIPFNGWYFLSWNMNKLVCMFQPARLTPKFIIIAAVSSFSSYLFSGKWYSFEFGLLNSTEPCTRAAHYIIMLEYLTLLPLPSIQLCFYFDLDKCQTDCLSLFDVSETFTSDLTLSRILTFTGPFSCLWSFYLDSIDMGCDETAIRTMSCLWLH